MVEVDGLSVRVQNFLIGIASRVAHGEKAIELVQHTPKRDKGPQMVPQLKVLKPGGNPHQYGGANSAENIVTFERLQFKSATANNGKRRAAQQYYCIIVDLYAQTESGAILKIATTESAPLVVRGRSPGHYTDLSQGTNLDSSYHSASDRSGYPDAHINMSLNSPTYHSPASANSISGPYSASLSHNPSLTGLPFVHDPGYTLDDSKRFTSQQWMRPRNCSTQSFLTDQYSQQTIENMRNEFSIDGGGLNSPITPGWQPSQSFHTSSPSSVPSVLNWQSSNEIHNNSSGGNQNEITRFLGGMKFDESGIVFDENRNKVGSQPNSAASLLQTPTETIDEQKYHHFSNTVNSTGNIENKGGIINEAKVW